MPRAKNPKKEAVMDELTEAQLEELREIDARLNQVLQERRVGQGGDTPVRMETQVGSITFRYETVRCGKENCSRCPHGPYWYAYWKEDGRTRSRYIGRALPGMARQSYEAKRKARLEKQS
ncbi:MAG: DUF6788 family protein [Anaerolineae bacterium]